MKPHKHAEVIKAWADGSEIEVRLEGGRDWEPCEGNRPLWLDYNEYRVKPREFPKSSLSAGSLCKVWEEAQDDLVYSTYSLSKSLAKVADAAIKQYILDLEKEAANGF